MKNLLTSTHWSLDEFAELNVNPMEINSSEADPNTYVGLLKSWIFFANNSKSLRQKKEKIIL